MYSSAGGEGLVVRRGGDLERDACVDIVETEEVEAEDMERDCLRRKDCSASTLRFRTRSAAAAARVSSAIPFLWMLDAMCLWDGTYVLAQQVVGDVGR